VAVHFGTPLNFGDRADEERSARVLREVTDTIRKAVQHLSGQEYLDSYAGSSRDL
jgi:1-acyl-sn-glycerol-3-phosphate acyltransferase